jgi:hypothetical protein
MNLLAAVPLICILAARDAQYMKEREQQPASKEALWIDSSGDFSAAPAIVQARKNRQYPLIHAVFGITSRRRFRWCSLEIYQRLR